MTRRRAPSHAWLTSPTASSSDVGRLKQALGAAWEATLEHQHRVYRDSGLAFVVKRGPPVTVLGSLGRGVIKARITGEGPTDYGGVLAGGRAVDLEAKSTSSHRWSLEKLKPHQASCMDMALNCSGMALVALKTPEGMWVLPWVTLGPVWHQWRRCAERARWDESYSVPRGEASLTAADCDEIGARMQIEGDWLGALRTISMFP